MNAQAVTPTPDLLHQLTSAGLTAPRYTSYPAHPHWNGAPTEQVWLEHLKELCPASEVDLYVHIPFCQSLCHYCGCNRIITRDQSRSQRYLEALLKEIDLYSAHLPALKIRQLHLGGGTPTFLTPDQLQELCGNIARWNANASFTGSVEVDPRVTDMDHLTALYHAGFRKLSLGIQDFDLTVQSAIHRHQPFELVQMFLEQAREIGAWEVNFDLIYGLPAQNEHTITTTIEKTLKLNPHTISFFSYAHVPWKMPHQKLLERFPIPDDQQRLRLFECGKQLLEHAGYVHLGLDHFAREGSQLLKAYRERTMGRNFMGHVTHRSPVLLGLGASSIAATPSRFVQNHKEVETYQEMVEKGALPLDYGHELSQQDRQLGAFIHDWLCYQRADLKLLQDAAHQQAKLRLRELEQQGLVTIEHGQAVIPPASRPIARWLCAQMDWRLKQAPTQHSRL